ncbi:lauroyl-Kdo(2)-lipid IV(A) myristoyltransferase [Vibrio casei]|uniref:Lipid A biosynthesis acyltransferase n=1 Tax=Vibrio casei TaxID=673372 RepID=A0A368LG67_9VIBR|nr:lauroyl-Kdo(2)-lipid IV(A) myristoyltransferase [Vibrio casei]RCS69144.1 lauroyl-Kdo(2)-lipid IV(A) myristoyltransferase [Vibrio casei]SJN37405.1 Lipid A biosynthesis (KDO) 2-(lauroyl)-lipid IVA acyltransferase [Vibrio casei]
MTQQRDDFDEYAYNPKFQWGFLAPKYWGTWIAVFFACLASFLPKSIKQSLAQSLAKLAVKPKSGAGKRARVNLSMCFPDKAESERETMLYNMYVTAIMFMMSFASTSLRNKQWLEKNTTIRGFEHVEAILAQDERVILLVPHTWAIDIPAILLASRGLPVSAMAKSQKNLVADWLMHKQRVQYGGRVYDRSVGIKPFIKSVRKDGYLGYYLPDEDLGRDHSVFVDFFSTQKATISGLGRLAKLSKAKIVPLFAMYNSETGQYELDFYPALPFPTGDEHQDARMMNECIEEYVTQKPDQYMWILRLLKTRPDSHQNPYKQR